MDSKGQNIRQVTHLGTAGGPVWSPDGSKITFDAFLNEDIDIFIIDADGKNLRQITRFRKFDEYPDWSADGKQIVFTSRRDGNEEIYKIDIEGLHPERLTAHVASDLLPRWQPKIP